jgi:hypothetical protein
MAELLAGSRQMIESTSGGHLQPMEVASYVDGVTTDEARARIDGHLAECAECRDEIVEATRIAGTMSRPKLNSARVWIPAAAAAAVLLLMVRQPDTVRQPSEHREAPVTTTIAPSAITPVGSVDSVAALVWSSVPYTDRYVVRVFDAEGSVVWQREGTDTTVSIPPSLLALNRSYFWKVEAQTGFGRSAATELIEFSVRRPSRR